MEIPLLPDIVIILGLSVLVIFAFQKLKLPTILGFLLTGILAGPYGLSWVQASHEVEVLSEIGIILLLFIIGMEFSLKTLAAISNVVLIGGAVQVGGTVLLAWGIAYWLGFDSMEALFLGFLFSLSSTAIVLKALQERNEINAPHGKIALGILIFQDIIVVPMMLVTPIMAGEADNVGSTLLWLLFKSAVVIVAVIVSARYLVPRLLYEIAKTRSRELFILTIVVICFAVAWATSMIGLSLALGAFMAGLIISESDYSHQATGIIIPFREIFASFFFVSIGMLLDLSFLVEHLLLIVPITLGVLLLKFLIAALAARVLGFATRTVIISGLVLCQVGEFAFILSDTGVRYNMIPEAAYQYFLSISILTMAMTPFLINASPRIAKLFVRATLPEMLVASKRRLFDGTSETQETFLEDLKDHIIIIGYGVTGQNVARAARFAQIPYVIVDVDASKIKEAQSKGEPAYFGDGTNSFVLEHLKVWSARTAVVAISDPNATRAVVMNIRSICNTVYIIVSTRYVRDADNLLSLGANEIVPEEFEASVEIFTRLLNRYLVSQDQIERFVHDIREGSYQRLRPEAKSLAPPPVAVEIPDFNVTCLKVQHGSNEVVGKTLADADLRGRYRLNLLAIEREGSFITHVEADTKILQDDRLYVAGRPDDVDALNKKLKY